jgi:DNA invertase Pin-like site-specific DNA recombinase
MRIGYARVSTASGEQLSALDGQVSRVLDAGVERVITDVESGLSNERPGMLELLELIDTKAITEVVATRVDRLGRDACATDALIVLAAKRGVAITTLDGGQVEAETPTGFLLSRISTSLAEMESRMLSLRIRRGLEQRRKQAKPCRGRAPWGYRISKDRSRFEPHPQHWPQAQQFLALLAENRWRMNTALDLFPHPIPLNSCRAVKAWLKNPVVRGGIGYHQQKNHEYAEVVWGQHPPLVDPAQWDVIKTQLELNRRHWGANVSLTPNLLTGLCWCPNCDKRLSYAGSRKVASVICRTRGCVSQYKGTRESVVVTAINKTLTARSQDLASIAESEPAEATELRKQIHKLEQLGDPDLQGAIEMKQAKLKLVLQRPSQRQQEIARALATDSAWENALPEELRAIYSEVVDRVYADRGEVVSVRLRI